MGNHISYIGSRNYIVDSNEKKVRMIPSRYKEVALGVKLENSESLYLTAIERVKMEVLLYRRELRISEPYVWELIEKESFKGVRFVNVKFGEDRYEARFGDRYLVCSKALYELAIFSLYDNYHIKSMN